MAGSIYAHKHIQDRLICHRFVFVNTQYEELPLTSPGTLAHRNTTPLWIADNLHHLRIQFKVLTKLG